ncbi:MAG: HAD family phosphatase, partial [Erysipelotrichaceae bacterium]|nr:HAD family phosphatase [Erysipelotrichaceae bacterium]
MKKLFVADVDGTLVNEYSEFETETIEAIKRFRKLGGTFMVATGRNPWELSKITCEVEDVVLNCVNGAVLVQNGKTIFSEYLGADQVRLAQKLCDKHEITS